MISLMWIPKLGRLNIPSWLELRLAQCMVLSEEKAGRSSSRSHLGSTKVPTVAKDTAGCLLKSQQACSYREEARCWTTDHGAVETYNLAKVRKYVKGRGALDAFEESQPKLG